MRPPAREAMVDAAERLIAERGLGAVSLREVQVAAGQRNKSAANYHFGSREGLIVAIVESRMEPVNDRRLALLKDLDAFGRGQDQRRLVDALLRPLAEATLDRPDSTYARFLAQALADPTASALVSWHLQASSFRIVCDRLAATLDDVPERLRAVRVDRVVSLIIVSLAAWEGGRIVDDLPMAARLSDLVDVCVAMLQAPVSHQTDYALSDDRPKESRLRE